MRVTSPNKGHLSVVGGIYNKQRSHDRRHRPWNRENDPTWDLPSKSSWLLGSLCPMGNMPNPMLLNQRMGMASHRMPRPPTTPTILAWEFAPMWCNLMTIFYISEDRNEDHLSQTSIPELGAKRRRRRWTKSVLLRGYAIKPCL